MTFYLITSHRNFVLKHSKSPVFQNGASYLHRNGCSVSRVTHYTLISSTRKPPPLEIYQGIILCLETAGTEKAKTGRLLHFASKSIYYYTIPSRKAFRLTRLGPARVHSDVYKGLNVPSYKKNLYCEILFLRLNEKIKR